MAKPCAIGVITGLPNGPQSGFGEVQKLGIETVQLQYRARFHNPQGIAAIREAASQTGIEITTVFCGFAGESYLDIPTVQKTVGLVPQETRAARVALIEEIADFARELGVARVAAHIGFIPEEQTLPLYQTLVNVVREICESLARRGQIFALETGQETARTLARFISDVNQFNLRVNFDPANMILYGNDNPIDAMNLLTNWIDGVHCKDGLWPVTKNELGEEVPFGKGEVQAELWLQKLLESGYRGPLTIEREIGGQAQKRDITAAKNLIENVVRSRAGSD
ncbi:Sugar phosphate isomerase/epimerase [Abditibacterium utsteinense]|uniref:Sugar phosphate isomerase/epimerase n=1 Tax=Abditibacterium utsteinense TaxID=1960156 RepID=A0A2S8SRZ0_9BACT|nr:sugar phosphate isomerase/epimerase family protein [Abditibacterium utsteinense]PQV63571.1 Sugar phosphate isomerase/epimerase [Abditibacterium utsteinense]